MHKIFSKLITKKMEILSYHNYNDISPVNGVKRQFPILPTYEYHKKSQ